MAPFKKDISSSNHQFSMFRGYVSFQVVLFPADIVGKSKCINCWSSSDQSTSILVDDSLPTNSEWTSRCIWVYLWLGKKTKAPHWKSKTIKEHSPLELSIINPHQNNGLFQKTIYLMLFGSPGTRFFRSMRWYLLPSAPYFKPPQSSRRLTWRLSIAGRHRILKPLVKTGGKLMETMVDIRLSSGWCRNPEYSL